MRKVVFLLTVRNRRELTLRVLDSLLNNQALNTVKPKVILLDDGSSDGTSALVSAAFPDVRMLHGDGSLYWNGGMRVAFQAAVEEGYDAYIWVNDDCVFYPDALHRLLKCAEYASEKWGPSIVVGSMLNPRTRRRSYGGIRKRGEGFRLCFDAIEPKENMAQQCDTMNGNFTLIPAEVVKVVGNLDGVFRHQLGDFDYGLRAKQAGFSVIVAPGYFGECADNDRGGTWRDRKMPFRKRWAHLMSPKGAPPKEWFTYVRRHYGWRWPLYAVSPYIKCLFC